MKKILNTLAFLFLSTTFEVAAESNTPLHNEEQTNDTEHILININAEINNLIKDKKLTKTYEQIDIAIKARKRPWEEQNGTYVISNPPLEIQDKIAFKAIEKIYNIAAQLPLIEFNEKYSNQKIADFDVDEIEIKFFTALAIISEPELTPEKSKTFGINRDEINNNRVALVAKILKTFRDLQQSSSIKQSSPEARPIILFEKRETENDELSKKEFIKFLTDSRKTDAESYLNFLEDAYARMLLRIYPGDASKIKQAVRSAGYEGKEVNEMLARTLTGYSDAEFLFKRKSKNDTRKNNK